MSKLLEQAIASLREAAEGEQSMRIGHEVAGVLYDALASQPAQPEPEPPEHAHTWRVLGWDRPQGDDARVVQACECGEAREVRL